MPDTTSTPAEPATDLGGSPGDPDHASVAAARRRRPLPVGPFGLLVITAIALLAALGVTKLVVDALTESDAIDVQEALDGQAVAPRVLDTSVQAKIGSAAPDVRLDYLDGGSQQLAEVAGVGTPVVLNFWSSTCAPCLNEMPALEVVSQQLGDKVTVIGIDSQDTVESGQEMVEQTGVTYRNARDPKGEISTVFGALALPRTVLIDGDGRVVATHTGELDEAGFTQLLSDHGFPSS
jgi:peroxiredoxin